MVNAARKDFFWDDAKYVEVRSGHIEAKIEVSKMFLTDCSFTSALKSLTTLGDS